MLTVQWSHYRWRHARVHFASITFSRLVERVQNTCLCVWIFRMRLRKYFDTDILQYWQYGLEICSFFIMKQPTRLWNLFVWRVWGSDFYSGRCIQVSSCLIAQIVISKITCLSNQLEVLIWVNTIIFDVKIYDILQSIYSKCPGRNPLQQHLHTKLSDLFLYSEGFQRKHGLVYYGCWYVLIQVW